MIKISPAYRERDDLNYYTQVDALLLTNDKVLSEARERDYKRVYIYQTIGVWLLILLSLVKTEAP
jgi:hypothetical protein